jgi:hypothetical protein
MEVVRVALALDLVGVAIAVRLTQGTGQARVAVVPALEILLLAEIEKAAREHKGNDNNDGRLHASGS